MMFLNTGFFFFGFGQNIHASSRRLLSTSFSPAGITGIILHELLGVDGLYPTGGLASGAAPPTIF